MPFLPEVLLNRPVAHEAVTVPQCFSDSRWKFIIAEELAMIIPTLCKALFPMTVAMPTSNLMIQDRALPFHVARADIYGETARQVIFSLKCVEAEAGILCKKTKGS